MVKHQMANESGSEVVLNNMRQAIDWLDLSRLVDSESQSEQLLCAVTKVVASVNQDIDSEDIWDVAISETLKGIILVVLKKQHKSADCQMNLKTIQSIVGQIQSEFKADHDSLRLYVGEAIQDYHIAKFLNPYLSAPADLKRLLLNNIDRRLHQIDSSANSY